VFDPEWNQFYAHENVASSRPQGLCFEAHPPAVRGRKARFSDKYEGQYSSGSLWGTNVDLKSAVPALVNVDVSGAGLQADLGTASIQIADDMVFIEGALDQHLVFRGHRAGAGGCVEGERGVS